MGFTHHPQIYLEQLRAFGDSGNLSTPIYAKAQAAWNTGVFLEATSYLNHLCAGIRFVQPINLYGLWCLDFGSTLEFAAREAPRYLGRGQTSL